jgi:hypothetical protein
MKGMKGIQQNNIDFVFHPLNPLHPCKKRLFDVLQKANRTMLSFIRLYPQLAAFSAAKYVFQLATDKC